MGKLRGFLEYDRIKEEVIDPKKRIDNYNEFTVAPSNEALQEQGGRCMDCGVPFCHSGCPLGNLIPDFNDAVYKNQWEKALHILQATNNFPEFTGRLCPAPCEEACVLGITNPPVSIELIEKYIVERGFAEGWIKPQPPTERTGKTIAVVGSGPAGLAAAQQLNRAGHTVTVFERDNKVGGLLRYGIPDFKMEKNVIDRRLEILEAEGIIFKCNIEIGKDISAEALESDFDVILLAAGATIKRNLPIPGSELIGVVQAMDFLPHNNKAVDGQLEREAQYLATDRDVIVIGGGDTGSDCIGTSNRQGAKSVTNFEIMPKPADGRTEENPWPYWPFKLKTSSSHEEGSHREWSILTKEFVGDADGNVVGLKTVQVRWKKVPGDRPQLIEKEGSEKEWPCDMALLALGFTGPEKTLPEQLGVTFDERGNVKGIKQYQTNKSNIFAAGDVRRGQSLIVWAISEGREAAHQIDTYLMGTSTLPKKEASGDLVSA
ncbi:glutamate synthase subunit beta [Flavobacteriaceae bacterium]|uniref:glutamate synthase subunit beta n=1 Tax=Candidatus Arcticimaribacter forsetii TaxID=2820661 RepID=UPI0020772E07|nr:glutamate synthase subunit beta [Candidatus Arcticimaribacter forsetii]MDA8698880.1 glutamate synthase subunit beta [Flavobacteriaceae bacterium]MDB2325849.1 glutamate synthase subunit beta [Flavobacteriaceae bacterium]MDB2345804.1 glutamate synthase subunit beta [Flavobacteriaceae bacterium]MDB4674939.1 glutamate synthase subunit beta [Flavobacteriaceae bacterium]MDB4716750.1 glutamate synthase subunit beta [Flavobacteriaceae bacterium]